MDQPSVIHNTFVLERSYPKAPHQVFAAFADAAKKRRWYGDAENRDIDKFESDFRTGGVEHSSYRLKEGTPFTGVTIANDGIYYDIVPDRRIVTASVMTFGDRRISASLVTFEFLPSDRGTDLICTHQGTFFEGADGPERREAGWRTLLDRLAAEVLH
ncbi:MAG TPA: SRPBCC domain-containing protein [Bryobacteraceae bacterium]|jgi:uncharacterized protein YndB with AHSA1/START domain|nr:SRPBCC domain-containing protein [Bryobacteraceae bacterium]